jgi:hypothetical protein
VYVDVSKAARASLLSRLLVVLKGEEEEGEGRRGIPRMDRPKKKTNTKETRTTEQ